MKNEKNTLVFVYSNDDVNRFSKKQDISGCLFVLCDITKSSDLEKNNINFIPLDKFLDKDSFKGYIDFLFNFSNKVFKDFSYYTEYKGINLGQIFQCHMKYIISEPLFFIKHIEPIIRYYKPKKIFAYNNNNLDTSNFFSYFNKDPLIEVLEYLKPQFSYEQVSLKTKMYKENRIRRAGLNILKIFQDLMFKINSSNSKKAVIIYSGGVREARVLINSSNLTKDYAFYDFLNTDGPKFNFSKDFLFKNFYPLISPKNNSEYFSKKYNEILKDKNFRNQFIFGKKDIFGLYIVRLEILFKKIFPLLCYYIDEIEKQLSSKKIKAVCLSEDVSSFSKVLVHLANKKDIPTFVMQYGLNSKEVPESFWPSESKYKIIWGEADKKLFMDFGVKKENIFVVGAPRFYNYRKKISKSRNEILSQLKINPNKKIILYTSQYIPFNMQRVYYPGYLLTQRDYQEILDTLIATFSELKDFHLILRLRPGADDFNFVQEKISSSGLSNITLINPKEIPIADNINSCDALITHWSTTGMEAMLLDKPLLVFKIKNKEDFVEFLKYKAGYGFSNKKELTILLKNLKKLENKEYSKNQKKYLDEYLGLNKKLNAFEVMLKIIKYNK